MTDPSFSATGTPSAALPTSECLDVAGLRLEHRVKAVIPGGVVLAVLGRRCVLRVTYRAADALAVAVLGLRLLSELAEPLGYLRVFRVAVHPPHVAIPATAGTAEPLLDLPGEGRLTIRLEPLRIPVGYDPSAEDGEGDSSWRAVVELSAERSIAAIPRSNFGIEVPSTLTC